MCGNRNFTIQLLLAAVLATGCARPLPPDKGQVTRPEVDFDKIIRQKEVEYPAVPPANTKASLNGRRARIQDQVLEEFSRCPECFVRKITGAQRTYLFDAVVDCETAIRIGSPFDGGKWICSPQSLPPRPVVYSFGIGDDISFDAEMAGRFGCDVFMFDPSPSVVRSFEHFESGRRCGPGRLYFEPVGLGPISAGEANPWQLVIEGKACPVQSFAEIARSHNHSRIDILKIDIEGGEFAVLQQMIASNALASLRVRQLLVEFHLINDECFTGFMRIMGELKKQGFLLFRKEFNPYSADKCAEFAFVKLP
jgi:hypothetical protein